MMEVLGEKLEQRKRMTRLPRTERVVRLPELKIRANLLPYVHEIICVERSGGLLPLTVKWA